jgi:YD repeat-containing protein
VLSAGFGGVFNDTATQSGAVTVARNTYDGQDRLTLAAAPEGGTTGYAYSPDLQHNIVQATRTPKPGSPLPPLSTSFAYDPVFNRPTRLADPLGLVTTLSYDAATGNLLSAVADSGVAGHFNAATAFTYNAHGQVLSAADPLGATTQFAYDGLANPIQITRDAGAGHLNQVTAMSYSASGDVTALTDPNGNVTTRSYDAGRRVTGTTTPAVAAAPGGLVTSFAYDADGRLLTTQQSGGVLSRTTSASYTLTGKVATTTDANGNVTTSTYDAVDRLSTVIDAAGRATTLVYDPLSRVVQRLNLAIQAAPLEQYAYNPNGTEASLADGRGNVTRLG